MKTRLIPLYFDPGRDEEFDRQVEVLRQLLAAEAELMPPVPLGSRLPDGDAVVLPQLLGAAYSRLSDFQAISLPILIVTSEFGTVSMWDWEIISYLASAGVHTIAPTSPEETSRACRAIAVRRKLMQSRFLVFQDNPGEGLQASIFKRFYWWEAECVQRMKAKFGVAITRKSYRELATEAKRVPDEKAREVLSAKRLTTAGTSEHADLAAVKLYLAARGAVEQEAGVIGAGANCLNESHFSDSTPCLAWTLLFEELGLTWGCEADTVSMLTQYILYECLGTPVVMTNLYPFLMGEAALKHERIPHFPPVSDPEHHVLLAHCGYLGLMPPCFATEWTLRPKVLAIVGDDAIVVDARLQPGPVTLVKLGPTMDRITVGPAYLEGYVQYPGSDCLSGGVLRVQDGPRFVHSLPSHHCVVIPRHRLADIELLAAVFGLEVDIV